MIDLHLHLDGSLSIDDMLTLAKMNHVDENTILKEKIDDIIFSELTVKKKRIGLRKLKKQGLEPKFINMFIGLLEFIDSK